MTTREEWEYLYSLQYPETIKLEEEFIDPGIKVTEFFENEPIFQYVRRYNGTRQTFADKLGFVGVTTTDLLNRKLYITEGVSDFLSLKAHFPNLNVWGKTKLNLSALQVHAIKQMFDEVVFIADNDSTGVGKAFAQQDMLRKRGLKCSVYLPVNKDITLDIIRKEEINIK